MSASFHHNLMEADWVAHPAIRAFTTLRGPDGDSQPPFHKFNLGARSGDEPQAVARNREQLVERFGLPSPPRWMQQVHGTRVARFDGTSEAGDEPEADAAVTVTPGVVLAILTADCLPVLFCSDAGDEVAAAHAGWRGLCAGVLERTLAAMTTDRGHVSVWLGPAAGRQAYEVGEDVRSAFVDGDPSAAVAFVATRPGHWLCDLYALARQRLSRAGVTRVAGGGLCTISDPERFYSFRRDGRTGRMASLICIKPARSIA